MINAVVSVLIGPSAMLIFLTLLGTVLLWTGFVRSGRWLVSAALLELMVILALPVDQWMLAPLENRFAGTTMPAQVDGIIVLGGAVETGLWQDRGQPALNDAADRMTEFAILARRYPIARLVFTGGNSPARRKAPPEAEVARDLFLGLGIAPERLRFEDRSSTTWENALFSKALINPKPDETWLLVTSANHLPRAMGAFRAVGWDVVAMPVGYKTFRDAALRTPRSFAEKLSLIEMASHEWIGLLAYWAQGHSNALFPAPG